MNKSANYEINHIEETIIVTKRFYKAASVISNPEYKELMTIRRDNPTFKVALREIRKKVGKRSYRNLTYDNMRAFITAKEQNEATRTARLAQLERVIELSKVQPGPYAYVKVWFLDLYGSEFPTDTNEVA